MRGKRTITGILSFALVMMLTLTVIPVLGSIVGIDGSGIISEAATEAVTVGTYNGGSSITAVNGNGFILPSYDLARNNDSTGVETVKAAVRFSEPIMDDHYNVIDFGLSVTNDSPAGGVFSAYGVAYAPPSKIITFNIGYDPRMVSAGIYTADLRIALDHAVVANNGALNSDGNVITVPMSVTFTGDNPLFEPAVTSVSAEPGNNQNIVRWRPVEGCSKYTVFRREGRDISAASPQLGAYSYIATVRTAPDRYSGEYQFTDPAFVDHYAENGMTYSYIVFSGDVMDPFSGNPSRSVSAAPRAARRAVPAAPYGISGYSNDGEAGIEWLWDAKGGQEDPETGGTDSSSGEGYIHHFNVYRNGRLFKQVQQNAAEQQEAYGNIYYEWSTRVSFERDDADSTFWVTAVDIDGNESVSGDKLVLKPSTDSDLYISDHDVSYYDGDVKGLMISIDCTGAERIEVWRKLAGVADSTYAKIALTDAEYNSGVDTGVQFGKVYTYKVIGHARDGRVTDPYIISVAADDSDESYYHVPGGWPFSMRLRTYDGESATVDIPYYGEGTYKLYRDGNVIKSWNNVEVNKETLYTDELTEDGSYSYHFTWTSKKYPSLTAESNTVVFVRNTSDPDPDELETVPAAPRLTGRVNGDSVTMSWTPVKGGGAVDGYIIYRTDNGIPNTDMWHNTWTHPLQDQEPNGRYISRTADTTLYDMSIRWNEGGSPHRLWVVAYNDLGMSEPSNVLVYSDDNGQPPANVYTEKPGAPESVSAWCENDDRDGTLGWFSNRLKISWATPSSGGAVSKYHYVIAGSNGREITGDKVPGVYSSNSLEFNIGGNDITSGVEYTITISAVNDKGTVAAAPVKITPVSGLAFKAEAVDNTSARLSWTELKDDDTAVTEYQIWRRANLSKWEKVKTVEGTASKTCTDAGLEPGTLYEYYVAAPDSNGVIHKSVLREVRTTSRTEVTEAPSDLSARDVNGDVILSWAPPAAGGRPVYYILEYQTTDKDPSEESDWRSFDLSDEYYGNESTTGAFGNSTGAAIMSWQYDDDHSGDRYSAFRNLAGTEVRLRVRPYGYGTGAGPASSYIVFTWPGSSSVIRKPAPAPITPEVIEGDGKVTLRWDHVTGDNEAAFYQILRTWDGNKRVVFTVPVMPGKTSYEFVDDDTDIENGRQYTYELRPCNSNHARDSYGNEYWYSNLCYIHQVTAVPDGPTTDQKVADNISELYDSLIDSKPEPLTEEFCIQVKELENNYGCLTKYQKDLLGSEKCAQIEALIEDANAFLEYEEYGEDPAVASVIAEIGGIDPAAEVDEAYENQVNTARANYDALPEGAKSLVSNYGILTSAEAHIKQVKRDASDQIIADDLSARLAAIDVDAIREMTSETLTEEAERNIANLRWEYDSLTKAQKAKVSEEGLQKLEDAEAAINDILGIDHAHDLKAVAAKEATCNEKGSIRYYKCKKCGRAFTDPEGSSEITDMTSIEIPADPSKHDWTEWTVKDEASCTSGGTETRRCNICGAAEERSFEARDHDWDSGEVDDVQAVDAEGNTYSQITYHCRKCSEIKEGRIYQDEDSECGPSGHVWSTEGEVTKPASCTTNGEIRYTCTICHSAVKYDTQIDPLAHKWADSGDGWTEDVAATCTESGSSKRTCMLCGETETRTDEALGHDFHQIEDDENYVEPGCGTAGQKTLKCSRCDETTIEEIPATGNHTYGDWEETLAPTCTEAGMKVRHCSECDNAETAAVAPLGHKWDSGVVTIQPAVGVEGIRTYTCSVCGISRTEGIAALVQNEIVDLPTVKISKPKAGKKKLTAKWSKVSKKNQKKIQGIEILVTGPGYNKTFTAGKKKTSKAIKGLMSKNKYTVSVRAYRWEGSIKHVSKWKSKTVKIK